MPQGAPASSGPSVLADVPLRGPAPGRLTWPVALLGSIGSAAAASVALANPSEDLATLGLLAIGMSIWLAFRAQRAFRWTRFRPQLRLTAETLSAPLAPHVPRRVQMRFADIAALSGHTASGVRVLMLATGSRRLVLTSAQLGGALPLSSVEGFVRARIAELPNGAERLADFEAQTTVAATALQRRPWLTQGIFGALLAFYMWQWSAGALEDSIKLINLGSNVPWLVHHGEWHRLASATMLHGGPVHLMFNAFALVQLGGLLERLMGWRRLGFVFVVAAISGAWASAMAAQAPQSVGASTALFGLLGAFAWLHARQRRTFPALFRQSLLWWVVIGALNGLLPILVPVIDSAGHLGGFLGGLAATALLYASPVGLRRVREQTWAQFASVGAMGAFVAGLAVGVSHAVSNPDPRGLGLLTRVAESGDPEPTLLNLIAWTTAIDPGASTRAFEVALSGLRVAREVDPEEPAFADTEATLLHRLGRHAEGTHLQLGVLRQVEDSFSAGQLLRFAIAARADAACAAPRHDIDRGRVARHCLRGSADAVGQGVGLAELRMGGDARALVLWSADAAEPRCVDASSLGTELAHLTVTPICWIAGSETESARAWPTMSKPRLYGAAPAALALPGPVQ